MVVLLVQCLAAGPLLSGGPVNAAASTAQAAKTSSAPVAIEHDDVDCVVAGQHPKLSACFVPSADVARARIEFRSLDTEPWYYVELAREGDCYSALLPKPLKSSRGFHYFVDAINRDFGESREPERAPDRSHAVRVVAKEVDCHEMKKLALMVWKPAAPIVVGIARNAAGKAVAAGAASGPVTPAGFSSDGLASTTAASTSGGGGVGKALLVVGGLAAAGAGAALALRSADSSTPPSLTGRWTGLVANGEGASYEFSYKGIACVYAWDITLDLTQSGDGVTGTGTETNGRVQCTTSARVPVTLGGGSGSVAGSVTSGSQVTLNRASTFPAFTGTFNASSLRLVAKGDLSQQGVSIPVTATWALRR
jgi:hypothetical protein